MIVAGGGQLAGLLNQVRVYGAVPPFILKSISPVFKSSKHRMF